MPRLRLTKLGQPERPPVRALVACAPSTARKPQPTANYAALFKALADETRLEIVGLLAATEEPLCACHVESHFDLSQPTISHHLRVLRRADVLTYERRGTWMYYALSPKLRQDLALFLELLSGSPAKTKRALSASIRR